MRLEQYRDPEGFERLQAEWNQLVAASNANTAFSTWQWQNAWWQHLGRGELRLTAVRDDADNLVGIFPLFLEEDQGRRCLRLIGCVEVADYLDLILTNEANMPTLPAFVDYLQQDAGAWDLVDLCNVPESSPTFQQLPEIARAAGLQAETDVADVCPMIRLPDTWDRYLEGINKKQRHEIRRKLRRAEGIGEMEWYIVGPEHDLHAEIETFLALHQQSSSDKESFMDERMRAFFHGLAQALLDAGWLQLMQLKFGQEVEASLLSFDYANAIMLYNSGYNPGRGPALSPGIVLISLAIRHAIELGRDVFDFLRGDEEYKYRFGAEDIRVHRVLIRPGV